MDAQTGAALNYLQLQQGVDNPQWKQIAANEIGLWRKASFQTCLQELIHCFSFVFPPYHQVAMPLIFVLLLN
jgi:hypothetical protein